MLQVLLKIMDLKQNEHRHRYIGTAVQQRPYATGVKAKLPNAVQLLATKANPNWQQRPNPAGNNGQLHSENLFHLLWRPPLFIRQAVLDAIFSDLIVLHSAQYH
jgi:hypothetical protein